MKIGTKFYLFSLFVFFISTSVRAQGFMITETLRDDNAGNFVFGGDPESYLTSGLDDPEGDGWLRLTKDSLSQRGYAVVKVPFPSSLGVQVDLEFKIWRTDPKNSGADGISVFLFNAVTDTFKIGGFGGSLGYAQFYGTGFPQSDGLSNGYVGFGLDEFGNYSKEDEGRIGGASFNANSIGVRGPAPTYTWLTGNFKMKFLLEHNNADIDERPTDSVYYRRLQLEITPGQGPTGNQYSIKARIKSKKGSKFVNVLETYLLPSLPPPLLKLGFAASTGSCINYHELRNLYITTPGGVRVTKQVNKLSATVGDELIYTIDLYNQTDRLAEGLSLKDYFNQIASKFTVTSVKFDNNEYTKNVATGYTNTDLSNVTVTMEPKSQATFIVKGRIKGCPVGKILKNTAIFDVGTSGINDLDEANDTARAYTKVRDLGLIAIDDRTRTGPDVPVTIPILTNDLESVSPIVPSSVEIIKWPNYGTAVPNPDGTVLYTPNPGYAGNDTLTYKMADESGKKSNIATVIITIDSKAIMIPNIFTPDGDGINDVFEIPGLFYYTKPQLRITNRWGDEVYYSSDYRNDWDGHGLNEGTYYYTLTLNDKGKKSVYKGWVLLKR